MKASRAIKVLALSLFLLIFFTGLAGSPFGSGRGRSPLTLRRWRLRAGARRLPAEPDC